jgi:hypothetical protein
MNLKEKKREREISYLYANKGKKGTVECFIPTRGTTIGITHLLGEN